MNTITLDWISFTFDEDTHEAARWVQLYSSPAGAMETSPRFGYTAARTTRQGVVFMRNDNRPEMGYHIIISGSALRALTRELHVDQQTLLASIGDAGGRTTRIDIAKDAKDIEISLDKIYQAMERREHLGTARNIRRWQGLDGGYTIYVGSEKSEKMLRIYDKAVESNLQNCLWKRLELQTRGMVSRAVANSLVRTADWNAVWQEIVLHMVDLPGQVDWLRFFDPSAVEIGIPQLEKKSDREKWIQEQVIPAVVKHFTEHKDSAAVALLREMLDFLDKKD